MKLRKSIGAAGLSIALAACSNTSTRQRVERSPSGDTLEVLEVLVADSLTRQGISRQYYPGSRQLKTELLFEGGRLLEVMAEYEPGGQKRSAGSSLKAGTGTLNLYDDAGQLVTTVPYAGGWPTGQAELSRQGQPTGQLRWRSGLLIGVELNTNAFGLGGSLSSSSADTSAPASSPQAPISGVDPAWLDQLVTWIAKGDYQALYNAGYSKLKVNQTQADQAKYFNFCKQLYGELTSWKLQGYNLQSAAGQGEGLEVSYECKFRYTPAQLSMLLIRENGRFRPAGYSFTLPPYTPILQITRIADPVVSMLKTGEFQKLYDQTSSRFKEQTSWSQFETAVKQLQAQGNIESSQLLEHEVGLIDHAIALSVVYEVKIAAKTAYLQMTFTQKPDGSFILEGLNMQ